MATSRIQQRRNMRRPVVLTCLAVAALSVARRAASAYVVIPSSMQGNRQAQVVAAVAEAPVRTRQAEKRNTTKLFNATLEFSSGYPDDNTPGVAQNPPWAKCVVEAEDRNMRDEHGSVQPRKILEEWVMRGTKEHIGTFQGWRQMRKDSPNVRCMETSLHNVQGVNCIECVSPRTDGLPLPKLTELGSNGMSSVFQTSFVMTFGLPQCLTGPRNGMGFCKSGSVTFAM